MGHRPSLPRNKLEIRGSVSRVLCTFPKEKAVIIHLGCPLPNTSCNLPGRRPGNGAICRLYLVLLPTGFTLPWPLPATRCALTAPFHPYLIQRRFAFCGTFPGVTSAGRYPAPCFRGARTFLPRPCRNKMRRRLPDPLTKPGIGGLIDSVKVSCLGLQLFYCARGPTPHDFESKTGAVLFG